MDKSKHRTDLLAAGRKKLQQFRQQKDHKGSSSSHGKSSGKSSKPQKDGDADESSKVAEPLPATDADVVNTDPSDPSVDFPAMPFAKEADGGIWEHKRDAEELPTVSLDHQEADCLGSQQCNGESLENRMDDGGESIVAMAADADRMKEDPAIVPSSGLEVAREVDGSLAPSEVSHEEVRGPAVSCESSEIGFSETENGRDGRHIAMVECEMERGGINEETAALVQEAKESSIQPEELQEGGMNLCDKPEKSTSLVGSLGIPSSSQDIPATEREDGAGIADAEEEGRNNEETAVLGCGRTQEASGSFISAEELLEVGTNLSDKPVEGISLEESLEIPSSSQDIQAIKGEDGGVLADEEGERRNDEEDMQQSERSQEANGSSVPGEGLQAVNSNLFYKPDESTPLEVNLEAVASFSEDIPATKREDGAIIADVEGERRNNEAGLSHSSFGEDATVKSESVEEIPEKGAISIGVKVEGINEEDSQVGISVDGLERISRHLYFTTVAKDVLQLQLAEQTEMNVEYYWQTSDEVLKLWDLVKESQESKAMVSEELEQCRSELQAMAIEKEEFETRYLSTKDEIEELRIRAGKLQNKLEQSQEDLSHVLAELADCRASLKASQKENLDVGASLISETDARKKLMEEKEFFSSENKKLASELSEQKERLLIALDKEVQLQSSIEETGACFEQLVEENLYLSSSLDIHKAKIKELDGRWCELPSQAKEAGHQGIPLLQKVDEEDSGNSFVLGVLRQHLEEAKNILQNLEKSVEGMHSHSVSLSRSGGRVAASGISKIIQAFESKTHHVDNVSDEVPLTEGGRNEDSYTLTKDSYTLTKEQTCSLRDTLKQMELDVGKAEIHLMEEQYSRKLSKKFEMECETHKQQNTILQERINELVKKVSDYQFKIVNLQNHIDELQQSANDEAARLLSQVEMLQKEVNDRASILKQEEDSIRGAFIEAIEKLNTSTGLQVSDNLDVGSHVMASVDAAVLAIKSLHEKLEAARLSYNTLQTSYEEVNKLFMDMQGRNELAIALLKKFYSSLRELVYDSYQSAGEAVMDVNANEALQLLPGNYDLLIGHLQKLLDERHCLLSTNNELESGLLNRNQEIEELNMRCNALAKKLEDECHSKEGLESIVMNKSKIFEELNNGCLSLAKKLEDHKLSKDLDAVPGLAESSEVVVKSENFCKSLLSRLEALVVFHLKKYEEVIEQINLSKNYLREVNMVTEISADNWSLPLPTLLREEFLPMVSELQEKLQLLSPSTLQQETEMHILKEGLSNMEEVLEASRSELSMKVLELEQSEQRVSSVREKLSIAVAKGKGLIVQRDSLKQSLMEKSSELEKCMQELQSKEALLHEVEAKLKSCSEVERVEALESELSYIRNSATALRDSFLLKDSVLQRIEEVLEDLDLPEHFHSKDIVEKIELLSRLVAGNSSFNVTDWDQKSSEGRSHSDAGFVVMDAWKDDIQPISNQEFDELKRKYEELQSKFYGLAEHNDMLEQSLVERNSLVQKWEEVLDRIDMPPHLRTLEPEDRIECLGRELSEIQQERDSLQLKIENLEVSSDMLIVDLEESHKKISELSAEVVAVKSEKDFFSESLEKLRFEYLALSEKAVHDELERENLQRELADLQEKLVEEVENRDHHDIENEIRKLHDLVCNAFPDNDKFENLSGGSSAESLERLLRKLIDNYTTVSSDKAVHKVAGKEVFSKESNFSLDKQTSEDVLEDKEQDLVALRSELNEASRNLVLVQEERDAAMEKCHSLTLQIEEISEQMNLFQQEKTKDMEKYQSLVLELEAIGKQRDALQEQLTQEEQKSASAREKLNVAVRKGKGLVQQRDALKQTIEEMNTVVERLKAEHNLQVEALQSEKSLLMNRLAETEHNLQDSTQTLSRLLAAVHAIDVSSEINIIDPVQKMEEIGKLSRDLHSALVSSENEAKKSKRAAELLLAELNEVQERADILQEELAKAEAALTECFKQKDDAEAAKSDALSHLEQFMSVHSEERKMQIDSLVELKSGIDQLRKGCFGISSFLSNVIRKDVDLFSYMESFMEYILKQMNGDNVADLPVLGSSNLLSRKRVSEENSHAIGDFWELKVHSDSDDSLIAEHLAHACSSLHECMREFDDLRENIAKHSFSIDQQATHLLEAMETVKRKLDSQKEFSESLKRDATSLELMIKEKETEISLMHKNVSLLYEACSSSIAEIENRKAQIVGNSLALGEHVSGKSGMVVALPSCIDGKKLADGHISPYTDDSIKMMADSLLSTVKSSSNINEIAEGMQKELKATILDMQRELQEKDIEMNRICAELVSQIREAESVSKRYVTDLDSARTQVLSLEKKVAVMENDKKLLESRVNELKDCEASSKELQERFNSLIDSLAAKDQEIEALTQALDEEESQMEALENRNKELEDVVQEKILALENLEASRAKALAKLSTTMSKFDELHNLSESLLTEIESLQSQLQGRDSEISFLRQEVTRCTNDVLASQETNKKYSTEIHELLMWMETMVSHFGEPRVHANDQNCSQIRVYTDILDKKIVSVMDELEDLRVTAQSKDVLLQIERSRVAELLRKTEDLETSIHGKEPQIELFQGERDSGQPSSVNSPGPLEIEQIVQRNKVSSGPIVTHIRSGRKVNNDQIAIAVDMEKGDNILDDEDDDKSHGFKSLTMSRLVPRATRPIAERIDGIWVSGERLLMRQPTLRLGVIIYWVVLHALLASII